MIRWTGLAPWEFKLPHSVLYTKQKVMVISHHHGRRLAPTHAPWVGGYPSDMVSVGDGSALDPIPTSILVQNCLVPTEPFALIREIQLLEPRLEKSSICGPDSMNRGFCSACSDARQENLKSLSRTNLQLLLTNVVSNFLAADGKIMEHPETTATPPSLSGADLFVFSITLKPSDE